MEFQTVNNSNNCFVEFVENYKGILQGLSSSGCLGDLELVSLTSCCVIYVAKMNYEANEELLDSIRKIAKALSEKELPHISGLINMITFKIEG